MAYSAFNLGGDERRTVTETFNQLRGWDDSTDTMVAGHQLMPGDCVRHDGGPAGSGDTETVGWVRALANNPANAEVLGVVESVEATAFTVVLQGRFRTDLLTENLEYPHVYFLSAYDAGKLVCYPPEGPGQVIKPVMITTDQRNGYVVNYVGTVIGGECVVDITEVSPVGQILPFAGRQSHIPDGHLLCDGSLHATGGVNGALFDVIGYDYGTSGNSSDFFRVPDLQGRFPLGVNVSGDSTGLTERATGGISGGAEIFTLNASDDLFYATGQGSYDVTGDNMPPFTTVNFIIRSRKDVAAVIRCQTNPGGAYTNKIINGNFDFWERGTVFATGGITGSRSFYTADRWVHQVKWDTDVQGLSGDGIWLGSFPDGQIAVPNYPRHYINIHSFLTGEEAVAAAMNFNPIPTDAVDGSTLGITKDSSSYNRNVTNVGAGRLRNTMYAGFPDWFKSSGSRGSSQSFSNRYESKASYCVEQSVGGTLQDSWVQVNGPFEFSFHTGGPLSGQPIDFTINGFFKINGGPNGLSGPHTGGNHDGNCTGDELTGHHGGHAPITVLRFGAPPASGCSHDIEYNHGKLIDGRNQTTVQFIATDDMGFGYPQFLTGSTTGPLYPVVQWNTDYHNPPIVITGTTNVNDNQWHEWTFSRNGDCGEFQFHVDGDIQGTTGTTGNEILPPIWTTGGTPDGGGGDISFPTGGSGACCVPPYNGNCIEVDEATCRKDSANIWYGSGTDCAFAGGTGPCVFTPNSDGWGEIPTGHNGPTGEGRFINDMFILGALDLQNCPTTGEYCADLVNVVIGADTTQPTGGCSTGNAGSTGDDPGFRSYTLDGDNMRGSVAFSQRIEGVKTFASNVDESVTLTFWAKGEPGPQLQGDIYVNLKQCFGSDLPLITGYWEETYGGDLRQATAGGKYANSNLSISSSAAGASEAIGSMGNAIEMDKFVISSTNSNQPGKLRGAGRSTDPCEDCGYDCFSCGENIPNSCGNCQCCSKCQNDTSSMTDSTSICADCPPHAGCADIVCPVGYCCMGDGICEVTTCENCESGTWDMAPFGPHYPPPLPIGYDCSSANRCVPRTEPLGACCSCIGFNGNATHTGGAHPNVNGCSQLTYRECQAAHGRWNGRDSICPPHNSEGTCGVQYGVCCHGGGNVPTGELFLHPGANSAYKYDGVVYLGVACSHYGNSPGDNGDTYILFNNPFSVGCDGGPCLCTGTFVPSGLSGHPNQSTYWSNNTLCNSTVTGACCHDFDCSLSPNDNCTGGFQGYETLCTGQCATGASNTGGACCDWSGNCFITQAVNCNAISGTWHGDGTTCAGSTCTGYGACCNEYDFSCLETTIGGCTGGFFITGGSCQGASGATGDNSCLFARNSLGSETQGACCVNGEVTVVNQGECDDAGGNWHGTGTSELNISCCRVIQGQSIRLTSEWKKYTLTFTVPNLKNIRLGSRGNDYLELNFFTYANVNAGIENLLEGYDTQTPTNNLPCNYPHKWSLAQVQVEQTANSSVFENRSLKLEKEMCERYFEVKRNFGFAVNKSVSGNWNGASGSYPVREYLSFSTEKMYERPEVFMFNVSDSAYASGPMLTGYAVSHRNNDGFVFAADYTNGSNADIETITGNYAVISEIYTPEEEAQLGYDFYSNQEIGGGDGS